MTRIEKVIEGMRQMNLEQFLVTDPMAVYYLTGQYYACGERMMVLRLDVEKEPVLVIGKLFPQDEEKLGIKVVYFDDTWHSYFGSDTFNDGERVVKWKYCKDCL